MIEVANISKKYGAKQALADMSIDIQAGEVVGLLGLNGAGKSTAMNIMTGYIRPDSGYVKIGGYDVARDPLKAKKKLGYLPEQFSFYSDMKVEEYLDFICDIKKIKQGRKQQIDDLCERVGISHIRGRMIRNLSKGYRQRVGFLQALLGNPEAVILDEPTVGLDPSQIVEIRSLIRDFGEKSTVVISSHILSEVQQVCSRVVLLHNGRIIADDTPDRLRKSMSKTNRVVALIEADPELVKQTLGGSNAFKTVALLGQKEPGVYEFVIEGEESSDVRRLLFPLLAQSGLTALSINSSEFTLEDYFLKHIGIGSADQAKTEDKEMADAVNT